MCQNQELIQQNKELREENKSMKAEIKELKSDQIQDCAKTAHIVLDLISVMVPEAGKVIESRIAHKTERLAFHKVPFNSEHLNAYCKGLKEMSLKQANLNSRNHD